MKNKLIKFLESPKFAIPTVLILCVIAGALVSISHRQNLQREFKNLGSLNYVASTTIGSNQDLTLAFPIGGRIKSVYVKVGDFVTAGTVLASLDDQNVLGAVNQAKGAYSMAQNAYEKLLNGASTPEIEVAKVSLQNAKINYDNIVSQQKILVNNAFLAMMNSGLVAVPTVDGASGAVPIISGTYNGTDEGVYTVKTFSTGRGIYYSVSGLEDGPDYPATGTPSPLGTKGLYIQFPNPIPTQLSWTISIPNVKSPTYLSNSNAYKSALQNQSQAVASAKGVVDAAQAALDLKLSKARLEDIDIARSQVESAQGALQIAQGNYNNTLITAPADGKIINVSITAGQIASPNVPAIEILTK